MGFFSSQILDPFLEDCRGAAHFLLRVMQEMALTQGMPDTSREAIDLMQQHEKCVSKALQEPVLQSLQNSGEDALTMIKEEALRYGPEYR